MNEHHEASQFLIEQGALSIRGIQDLAAIKIQSWLKGVRVRKTFMGCKKLLMKHEQLRRCAAKFVIFVIDHELREIEFELKFKFIACTYWFYKCACSADFYVTRKYENLISIFK